ncbi:MAG: nucleotide exchange factor GrpE [Gemmatimonadaceae bacterium]|nr:nucleotide exchange factor GrpE [Gemmatimonadaceae bacterium]NUQ91622.1 nucleotide exchange factor GrpE [Gemmatimonadaceae bacterium]NUR18111.1 nucleotide exchange factor GrpE [Gemmatimonadaceae bacterium]NUS99195.1 nucleotide exchange factor GrpE [Gemmatimonadaceae bacterium]
MTERPDQQTDSTLDGAELPRGGDEQGAAVGDGGGIAERDLAEQRDKYLRLAAEYDNFRKRAQRERLEAGQRGQAELVKQLIDPLDDLARFAHVDPATVDAATVVQGADMVEKKLHKALAAAGLTVINPVDQPFDPELHEAVATEPALSPEDDHMVSRVYQAGYRFGSQLLRPARVVVKQWNG